MLSQAVPLFLFPNLPNHGNNMFFNWPTAGKNSQLGGCGISDASGGHDRNCNISRMDPFSALCSQHCLHSCLAVVMSAVFTEIIMISSY